MCHKKTVSIMWLNSVNMIYALPDSNLEYSILIT